MCHYAQRTDEATKWRPLRETTRGSQGQGWRADAAGDGGTGGPGREPHTGTPQQPGSQRLKETERGHCPRVCNGAKTHQRRGG